MYATKQSLIFVKIGHSSTVRVWSRGAIAAKRQHVTGAMHSASLACLVTAAGGWLSSHLDMAGSKIRETRARQHMGQHMGQMFDTTRIDFMVSEFQQPATIRKFVRTMMTSLLKSLSQFFVPSLLKAPMLLTELAYFILRLL
jgi:hypothetical protein